MRIYRKEGRSENWYKMKDITDNCIGDGKEKFINKAIEQVKKNGNTKGYYKSVQQLGSKEAATPWNINRMYPGLTDREISEKVAIFFNKIGDEYLSLIHI